MKHLLRLLIILSAMILASGCGCFQKHTFKRIINVEEYNKRSMQYMNYQFSRFPELEQWLTNKPYCYFNINSFCLFVAQNEDGESWSYCRITPHNHDVPIEIREIDNKLLTEDEKETLRDLFSWISRPPFLYPYILDKPYKGRTVVFSVCIGIFDAEHNVRLFGADKAYGGTRLYDEIQNGGTLTLPLTVDQEILLIHTISIGQRSSPK